MGENRRANMEESVCLCVCAAENRQAVLHDQHCYL